MKRNALPPSLSFLTWLIVDGDASHCSGGHEGRDSSSGLAEKAFVGHLVGTTGYQMFRMGVQEEFSRQGRPG